MCLRSDVMVIVVIVVVMVLVCGVICSSIEFCFDAFGRRAPRV